jgi:hypothetical protein
MSASSSGLSSTKRTIVVHNPFFSLVFSSQSKIERRAFFDRSFRPNLSAVPVDDSLHRGQPYAAAWELSLRVKPLEGTE